MNDKDIEDSPFYIKYTGDKVENIQFKHSASFKKALTKHLKDKFHTNNFGESLRTIVEDYLQNQCLEQKLFEKTIVCIAKESDIKHGISLRFLFVKDEYTYAFQKEVDKGFHDGVMFIQVNKSSVTEYLSHNTITKKEHDALKSALEQYNDSDNPMICEIALNNWLDSYDDGVYGIRSDKKAHLGVNILNTTENSFGVIYRWYFAVDVKGNEFIKVIGADLENFDRVGIYDKDVVLNELYRFNKNKHRTFKHMFESHDLAFPKNAFERLQRKYERKLRDKENLDAELDRMKKELESFDFLD